MRLIQSKSGKQTEAEALAEVFGGNAKAEAVVVNGVASFHVVTHLPVGKCHAALHDKDLIISGTYRLDLDEPAGSGQYYVINLDGLDTHIVGIPTIEQAALRMAA